MLTISIDPIAFTIGSLTIQWYGIMVAVAVILMIIITPRQAKRLGITRDLYGLALWCIAGGFIGGRLTHVFHQWEHYIANPQEIIGFAGLAQNGMIVGVIVAGLIYMGVTRMRFSELLSIGDAAAVGTPLALAIGRVGCTLNGCCFGKPSPFESFPGAVVYTARDAIPRFAEGIALYQNNVTVPLYPTQIYHILWNLISFAIVWRFREKFKPPGSALFFYICLWAIGDLGIRFLRIGELVLPGLQQAQVISLTMLAIFLPWLIIKMRQFKQQALATEPVNEAEPEQSHEG